MIKKKSRRKKYGLFVGILLLLLMGCGTSKNQEITWNTEVVDEISQEFSHDTEEKTKQQSTIYVHVCGAVACPGVYEIPEGSRMYEAIAMAGGMLPEADENYLNLAGILQDGSQIQVLTKEETKQQNSNILQNSESTQNSKININTASVKELTQLSGIGDSRASAIIAYRSKHGSFQSIEQIKQVDGIKDGLFEKIKEEITVN